MSARRASVLGLIAAASVAVAACSSSSSDAKGSARDGGSGGSSSAGGTPGASAGGAAASSGGRSGTGGGAASGTGGLAVGMVRCGETVCSPLKEASTESFACCNDTGGCGLRLPISSRCFGKNQPGHVNPVCKPYELQGKVQFTGCCSPTGCGAYVTTAGIGCVPNADLGLPEVACVFDTIGAPGADAATAPRDGSLP